MKFEVTTHNEPLKLVVIVSTKKIECLCCTIRGDKDDNFMFGSKTKKVNKKGRFEFDFPFTPEKLIIQVYNEYYGDKELGEDKSFGVVDHYIEKKYKSKRCVRI